MVQTVRLCPNEGLPTDISKCIKVYYGDYEIPGIYSIEITDATLKILLDKANMLEQKRK